MANEIIVIPDDYVVTQVFNNVIQDREILEQEIRDAARKFLIKYPAFKIQETLIFDVYFELRCIVNLQLK